MAVRRIELRSSKINSLNEAKEGVSTPLQMIKIEKGKSIMWIILIFVSLVGYHCYDAYNEQIKAEEMQQKQGMDCLYQFKTEECNPLNLTEKCQDLVECVQKSAKDINEIKIMSEMIKRTSQSLSQTMLGPVALVFGVLLINFMKEKI